MTNSNLPEKTERGILATMDDETLASLNSIEDAIALLQSQGVEVTDITDLGDGFQGVDKDALVNTPFFLLDYTVSMNGKFTNDAGEVLPFVVVRVITADGRKCRFTDGSTGVAAQILSMRNRGVKGAVLVKAGLTVSEYDYVDEKGKHTPAKTFYLGQ